MGALTKAAKPVEKQDLLTLVSVKNILLCFRCTAQSAHEGAGRVPCLEGSWQAKLHTRVWKQRNQTTLTTRLLQ
jgi:hypothetical protein